MNNWREILTELGANPIGLVAGFVGGLIAVVMNEGEVSLKSGIAQVLSALAFSAYGTELIVDWLDLRKDVSTIGLMGLCLGLSGIFIAKGIMNIGKRFEHNPFDLLNKNKDGDTN